MTPKRLQLPDLSVLRRSWPEYESLSTTHTVRVNDVEIGGSKRVVIAGPCAVQSLDQTLAVAQVVRQTGGALLRGGAYKPRTNPYDFQGLGTQGLEILDEVRRQTAGTDDLQLVPVLVRREHHALTTAELRNTSCKSRSLYLLR